MIRNKRTTFAACIDTDSPLANRNIVPRLAGPIPDDATPLCFPTNSTEFIRQRENHQTSKSFRTPRQ
jgi:hypothetical protein